MVNPNDDPKTIPGNVLVKMSHSTRSFLLCLINADKLDITTHEREVTMALCSA